MAVESASPPQPHPTPVVVVVVVVVVLASLLATVPPIEARQVLHFALYLGYYTLLCIFLYT